jgi:hypothetical protein
MILIYVLMKVFSMKYSWQKIKWNPLPSFLFLALNSWTQTILLPHLPRLLAQQAYAIVPGSVVSIFMCLKFITKSRRIFR